MSVDRRQDQLHPTALRREAGPAQEPGQEELHAASSLQRLGHEIWRLKGDSAALMQRLHGLPAAERLSARIALIRELGADRAAQVARRAFGTEAVPPFLRSPTSNSPVDDNDHDEKGEPGEQVRAALAGSTGEALPGEVAARMGELLRHDVSHVQVHTDAAAARGAQALDARAVTVGTHVYFNEGEFAPGTFAGDRLLAHELTHVVQHDRGRLPPGRPEGGLSVVSAADPAEREAREAESGADRLARLPVPAAPARQAPVAAAPGAPVLRDAQGGNLAQLREAAKGNWIGSVDKEKCLALIRALDPTERPTARGDKDLMKRLASAFNARQMFQAVTVLEFALPWKVYWVDQAGSVKDVDWYTVLSTASAQDIHDLAAFGRGMDLLRPVLFDDPGRWQKTMASNATLQGLFQDPQASALSQLREGAKGNWIGNVDEEKCLSLIYSLTDKERDTARGDRDLMKRLASAFNAREIVATVNALRFALPWKVYWIREAVSPGKVAAADWEAMVRQAGEQEIRDLGQYQAGAPLRDIQPLLRAVCARLPGLILELAATQGAAWKEAIDGAGLYDLLVSKVATPVPDPQAQGLWVLYGDGGNRNSVSSIATYQRLYTARILPTGDTSVATEWGPEADPSGASYKFRWLYYPVTPNDDAMRELMAMVRTIPRGQVSKADIAFVNQKEKQWWQTAPAASTAWQFYTPAQKETLKTSYYLSGINKIVLLSLSAAGDVSSAELGGVGPENYAIATGGPGTTPKPLTLFQNHARHEIGHAVGNRVFAGMAEAGNDWAQVYGGWEFITEDAFRTAVWSTPLGDTLDIGGGPVNVTAVQVTDWLMELLKKGKELAGSPITAARGSIADKFAAIQHKYPGQDLVRYLAAVLSASKAEEVPDNAFRFPGYVPGGDKVYINCTRSGGFMKYSKVAYSAVAPSLGWYALSSHRELFAEIYTKKYSGGPVPPALNGKDPAAFFRQLEASPDSSVVAGGGPGAGPGPGPGPTPAAGPAGAGGRVVPPDPSLGGRGPEPGAMQTPGGGAAARAAGPAPGPAAAAEAGVPPATPQVGGQE